MLPVNVLPFKTEHFSTSESAAYRQSKESAVFQRCSLKELKELCDFFQSVDVLLLLLALRNGNTFAGVVGEHFHLHSIAEHIADEAEVMNSCLSRQRSAVFQAFAVKCQIVDKLLDMAAGDLVKSQMTNSRVNPHSELFHSLIGSVAKIELCIFPKPLFSEVPKLDVCSDLTFHALVLKQYRLLLKLFLDLLLVHTVRRLPCNGLNHLIT